jgi:DNA adenine methylase
MKVKIQMKTPISYYGGKQSMLKHILPLIPKHEVYVEPFFGGGAVFFGKEPISAEIINDYNGMVVNFYEQIRVNFKGLQAKIHATPFSRDAYKKAMVIYEAPYLFDPITKAWAFWVGTIQGFSNQIGSWRS